MSEDMNPTEAIVRLRGELADLESTYGADRASWPEGQRTLAERIDRGITKLQTQRDVEASRAAREQILSHAIERAKAGDPRYVESGFGGGYDVEMAKAQRGQRTRKPWDGLGVNLARSESTEGLIARTGDALELLADHVPGEGLQRLAAALDREFSADSAAYILSASAPAYVRAFEKVMRDPVNGNRMWDNEEQIAFQRVENARAAIGEGGTGSFLVPVPLDPSIVLTNNGVIDPVRQYARVETTISATWNGVSSAGTTAYWTAENTALTEGNPAFAQISATPQKLAAWLTASFEVFQDSNLAAQLPGLVGDAIARAEGDAWINGSGSGAPAGIIASVSGTAGSLVTMTTRGSFTSASSGDIYNMDNALTARARSGRPVWLMSRQTMNTIRSMSAAGNGSSFWANFGDTTPPLLLDHPIREASSVSSATTSGSIFMVLGDLSRYLITDRYGTSLEWVQNVVDGSGVPTGTRGWIAWKRTTGKVEDLNAFRLGKA